MVSVTVTINRVDLQKKKTTKIMPHGITMIYEREHKSTEMIVKLVLVLCGLNLVSHLMHISHVGRYYQDND